MVCGHVEETAKAQAPSTYRLPVPGIVVRSGEGTAESSWATPFIKSPWLLVWTKLQTDAWLVLSLKPRCTLSHVWLASHHFPS